MSKRENYQPSLLALMKAIENFDEVAVKNNDANARGFYHDLVDVVHTIKTHITEEEAKEVFDETFGDENSGC